MLDRNKIAEKLVDHMGLSKDDNDTNAVRERLFLNCSIIHVDTDMQVVFT